MLNINLATGKKIITKNENGKNQSESYLIKSRVKQTSDLDCVATMEMKKDT